MPHHLLEGSGWLSRVRGYLSLPARRAATYVCGTVRATLDFWVLSEGLMHAHVLSWVECDAGTAPHRPAGVRLRARLREVRYRQHQGHQFLPVTRVFGPLPEPADWGPVLRKVLVSKDKAQQGDMEAAKCMLGGCYKAFADKMELEVAAATGTELRSPGHRGKAPRVVWKAASDKPTPARKISYLVSALADVRAGWRWLYQAVQGLAGILGSMGKGQASMTDFDAIQEELATSAPQRGRGR